MPREVPYAPRLLVPILYGRLQKLQAVYRCTPSSLVMMHVVRYPSRDFVPNHYACRLTLFEAYQESPFLDVAIPAGVQLTAGAAAGLLLELLLLLAPRRITRR